MKFLLIWSFCINSNWVAGTALFNNITECLEAKEMMLDYKPYKQKGYVECKLIESDKEGTQLFNHILRERIELQVGCK